MSIEDWSWMGPCINREIDTSSLTPQQVQALRELGGHLWELKATNPALAVIWKMVPPDDRRQAIRDFQNFYDWWTDQRLMDFASRPERLQEETLEAKYRGILLYMQEVEHGGG